VGWAQIWVATLHTVCREVTFKIAILIRENEQSFTILCSKFHTIWCKKIAMSIVVLKLLFNYKIVSTKLHVHEMFGSQAGT